MSARRRAVGPVSPASEQLEMRCLFAAAGGLDPHAPPTAVADLNDDGRDDLVVVTVDAARGGGGTAVGLDVYLNDGKGAFRFAGHTGCDDADGVVAAEIAAGTNRVINGDGSTSQWPVLALKLYSVTGQPTPVGDVAGRATLALFDGDGKGGLAHRRTHVIPHLFETGDRRCRSDPYAETAQRGLAVADLNGDRLADVASWVGDQLVVGIAGAGGDLKMGPAQSNPLYAPTGKEGVNPLYENRMVGAGDLDGDGRADLVAVVGGAVRYLSVDSGAERPVGGRVTEVEAVTVRRKAAVRLADVDGDGGADDLVVVDGQKVSVGVNAQDATRHRFTWTQLGPVGFATRDALVGDADGDGRDDLFGISNVTKTRHDVAMNSVRNLKA